MILPTWFDHLEESFSYKEAQFKKFCPTVKTSCSPVNETPAMRDMAGYSTFGVFCDISEEIIQAHVLAQGHAQQEKKENDHVTRKDAGAVGPSPPLLAPVPGHIPSHGRAVEKDGDDPVLARPVVFLRTTEVAGRRTDVAGRRLQEGGHLLGEGHRLAEGIT